MTTDNLCFYLQNRLIQTGQTGGQLYSDTSPFSVPWPNMNYILSRSLLTSTLITSPCDQKLVCKWVLSDRIRLVIEIFDFKPNLRCQIHSVNQFHQPSSGANVINLFFLSVISNSVGQTRLEKLAREKHSSSLQKLVNYCGRSFITLGPEYPGLVWGVRKGTGDNLEVVWAKFSILCQVVLL